MKKQKPFNEDTGLSIYEPVPNNFFLILAACVIVILVGIAAWSTVAAIITAAVEIFLWIWYTIIFHYKNAKNGDNN